MSAPSLTSATPNNGATEVVLGTTIVVGFDQLLNTATINAATFSVTGPGLVKELAPGQLNTWRPKPTQGRETIPGTFAFSTDLSGNTVVTFTPTQTLNPNTIYTILVVGPNTAGSSSVQNTSGESLDSNYQWTFTTGDLDVSVPPPTSPIPPLFIPLDPAQIKIQQKIWAVGNDLSQQLTILFPANINTDTIDVTQILLSLEALLNDPTVEIPSGLVPTVAISGNTITITISGWPANPVTAPPL